MNPWEIIITVFGWFLLTMIVFGAVIILFAVAVGIARGVRMGVKPKLGKRHPEVVEHQAAETAIVRYQDAGLARQSLVEAFIEGATWAQKLK